LSHGAPAGVSLQGSAAAVAAPDSRLEVFVVGNDGVLWHIAQPSPNDGWTDWMAHGSPSGVSLFPSPAVAPNADGRLEVFVRGDDFQLWHVFQTAPNGGWSGWVTRGAPASVLLEGAPVVAPSADGRLEVFIIGSDGALWHVWQTAPSNGWSGWLSHGTPPNIFIDGTIALALNADGRQEIFALANDGAVWHIWQTVPSNGWSGWESRGSPPGVRF
jgi:hypothetical protein